MTVPPEEALALKDEATAPPAAPAKRSHTLESASSSRSLEGITLRARLEDPDDSPVSSSKYWPKSQESGADKLLSIDGGLILTNSKKSLEKIGDCGGNT